MSSKQRMQRSTLVEGAVGTDAYRSLFEDAVVGIYQTSVDGRFLRANPALAAILGYDTPFELVVALTDVASQTYLDSTRRTEFVSLIESLGKVEGFESEVRRADGATIWVSENARAVRDADGGILYYEGFVQDITQRKLAEAQLAYRLRLEKLITSVSSDFIDIDAEEIDDRIRQALAEVGEFFETDRAYIFLYGDDGRTMSNTHEWCAPSVAGAQGGLQDVERDQFAWFDRQMRAQRPVHLPSLAELPEEAVAERAEWQREGIQSLLCLPMVCAGEMVGFIGVDSVRGERHWDDDTIALLRIVGEVLAGAIHRQRAVQQRLLLEAQMQHSQKLESLGVLAGGIAHDFNNLLMGIMGNAELALMELEEEAKAYGLVRRIRTTAQRAADLTGQLLAYSGKGKFVLEAVDLSSLVQEMAHLLSVSISKKTEVVYELADSMPAIEADATQVRQVVMNLITNASDALGGETGHVRVRTGVMKLDGRFLQKAVVADQLGDGPFAFVEVEDDGCGMDEATRLRIFDPFFSTKFAGRGLGLAAVLGIVRSHHGAIWVDSEPGRGTRIRVVFPGLPGAEPTAVETPAVAAQRHGVGTVMVVDDLDYVRQVAHSILEDAGFHVVEASDGREALELLERHGKAIDLVILDLTMPNLSGEETFKEIRKVSADLPIVLSSGYSEQDAMARFAGQGLAGFVQKPYRPTVLLDHIFAALDAARKATR